MSPHTTGTIVVTYDPPDLVPGEGETRILASFADIATVPNSLIAQLVFTRWTDADPTEEELFFELGDPGNYPIVGISEVDLAMSLIPDPVFPGSYINASFDPATEYLKIKRISKVSPLFTFSNGAKLSAVDLNNSIIHLTHLIEEVLYYNNIP